MIRIMKPWFPPDTEGRMQELLKSGWLSGGKVADDFAARVAEIEGYDYGLATNSCSSALFLAAKILSPYFLNSSIRIPSITYPATLTACVAAGLNPLVCTSEFDMGVDLFGLKKDDREHWAIADAACSLGSKLKADNPPVACYSFHPRKPITTGEGGCLCTNNKSLFEKAKRLCYHGKHDTTFGFGYNMRMSDWNATLGLCQLDHLNDILNTRRQIVEMYNKYLSKDIAVFGQNGRNVNKNYNYQSLVVTIPPSEVPRTIESMKMLGVECTNGTSFLHNMDSYIEYLDPLSKFESPNYLTLPLHYELTKDNIKYICNALDVSICNAWDDISIKYPKIGRSFA